MARGSAVLGLGDVGSCPRLSPCGRDWEAEREGSDAAGRGAFGSEGATLPRLPGAAAWASAVGRGASELASAGGTTAGLASRAGALVRWRAHQPVPPAPARTRAARPSQRPAFAPEGLVGEAATTGGGMMAAG